ncbi:hypothetical protein L3i22_044600 [Actinoplanes sp. L3-i22]|nr:hypothetical protein L3i22_044600 [Actinoplanes sp. L3-i22]
MRAGGGRLQAARGPGRGGRGREQSAGGREDRGSGTFTYRTLVTGRVAGNPKAWGSTTYRVRC